MSDICSDIYAKPSDLACTISTWYKKWKKIAPEFSLTTEGFLLKVSINTSKLIVIITISHIN